MSRIDFRTRDFVLAPGRSAQPVQPRMRGAGVLLQQLELLDRHEQLVAARVAELDELVPPAGLGNRELPQPDELADPVVDVHHVIADLQIAEVGQERLRHRAALMANDVLGLEEIGLGEYLEVGRQAVGTRGRERRSPPARSPRRSPRRPRSARRSASAPPAAHDAFGAPRGLGNEHLHVLPGHAPFRHRPPTRGGARETPPPAGRPRDDGARSPRSLRSAGRRASSRRRARPPSRRRRPGGRRAGGAGSSRAAASAWLARTCSTASRTRSAVSAGSVTTKRAEARRT